MSSESERLADAISLHGYDPVLRDSIGELLAIGVAKLYEQLSERVEPPRWTLHPTFVRQAGRSLRVTHAFATLARSAIV